MSQERIKALRQAVSRSPEDSTLQMMLAEELTAAGEREEACDLFDRLLHAGAIPKERLLEIGRIAVATGHLDLARRCLDAGKQAGLVEGVADLATLVQEALSAHGVPQLVPRADGPIEASRALPVDNQGKVTFDEIGGLADVKKSIHRMIVLPFTRPDLYEKYGKKAGGGVLTFGPPGCGKTMLARATAHECGVPFVNIRIEDIVDPYFGVSEQNLHKAFEAAREQAPCVLFLDELDALAYARSKQRGSAGRNLVDQLLQEMDSMGADNSRILILGATNAPWDVDDAMNRPGRFDRVVFVPPPDEEARRAILECLLDGRPTANIDIAEIARQTPLFSGADLSALVDQALEVVIDEALDTGGAPPLEDRHLVAQINKMSASTLSWLRRAKNYVEFANRDERYNEVQEYLRGREAKRARL